MPQTALTPGLYVGPYERWVYGPQLGRPFAFPAVAQGPSAHVTALLVGAQSLPGAPFVSRLPPLWPGGAALPSVTPVALSLPEGSEAPHHSLAQQMANGVAGRFRMNFPINPDSWPSEYDPALLPSDWVPPATPPRAIIAVIDDGIPFAHRAFLGADGRSRISHCWLQSARAEGSPGDTSTVPFGRELVNAQIDSERSAHPTDEPRIYRQLGAVDSRIPELGAHLLRHATHGAHVLGACAGNDPRFEGPHLGDDVQIIAVQLPNTIAWDTSGFGKESYMLAALHYVLHRARAIAQAFPNGPQELPLVVNFSYGWSASRHDGQSPIEAAFQDLIAARKQIQPATALAMPMGNNFANRMHGQITGADLAEGGFDFGWHLPPDDLTSSYLELWFPPDVDPAGWQVSVQAPDGGAVAQITLPPAMPAPGGDQMVLNDMDRAQGTIAQLWADHHLGTRWRVGVAVIPTAYTRGQERKAPSGTWQVSVQATGAPLPLDRQINIWVHRDDDPASLRSGGWQSRLRVKAPEAAPPDPWCDWIDRGAGCDPAPQSPKPPLQSYAGEMGFVRGYGCFNGVASAPDVLRVAGYVHSTGRPSSYSGSSGLTRDGDQLQPWGAEVSVAAVSDDSLLRPGTASIGVLSGSGARLIGTSGAAPALCRAMVANAAAGRPLLDGTTGPLPLHRVEPQTPEAQRKHAARVGAATLPAPVGLRRAPGAPIAPPVVS